MLKEGGLSPAACNHERNVIKLQGSVIDVILPTSAPNIYQPPVFWSAMHRLCSRRLHFPSAEHVVHDMPSSNWITKWENTQPEKRRLIFIWSENKNQIKDHLSMTVQTNGVQFELTQNLDLKYYISKNLDCCMEGNTFESRHNNWNLTSADVELSDLAMGLLIESSHGQTLNWTALDESTWCSSSLVLRNAHVRLCIFIHDYFCELYINAVLSAASIVDESNNIFVSRHCGSFPLVWMKEFFYKCPNNNAMETFPTLRTLAFVNTLEIVQPSRLKAFGEVLKKEYGILDAVEGIAQYCSAKGCGGTFPREYVNLNFIAYYPFYGRDD